MAAPRISTTLLLNRAREACEATGLDYGPHYEPGVPASRAIVGRVALVKQERGRFDLEQVANEGGGIKQINGWCNNMNRREMLAYLDGMILAAKLLKPEPVAGLSLSKFAAIARQHGVPFEVDFTAAKSFALVGGTTREWKGAPFLLALYAAGAVISGHNSGMRVELDTLS